MWFTNSYRHDARDMASNMTIERERPVIFACQGDELLGIVHQGGQNATGLLFVTGGGQYRVGSHRLYVQLARRVADAGYAAFRFDHRGVGDSAGAFVGFDHLETDVEAALATFRECCPEVERIVLLGLCDGASALLLALARMPDIAGLILINPWVHSPALEARVRLSSYYLSRLRSSEFWGKILSGRFDLVSSSRTLGGYLRDLMRSLLYSENRSDADFVARMVVGLRQYRGQVLVVLSGQDLVAQQFRQLVSQDRRWKEALGQPRIEVSNLSIADHTFSYREHRVAFENHLLDWMAKLKSGPGRV